MKRLLISALAVSLFTSMTMPLQAMAIADNALPQIKDGGIVNGSVGNIEGEVNGLNVKVNGGRGAVVLMLVRIHT